jgi:hypothetical protein
LDYDAEPEPAPADRAYLERARRLTERLSAREVAPGDVGAALAAARDVAALDADAPTTSARPEARLFKAGVKRMVAWYMVYLAEQVNDLGFALVRLGEALAAGVEHTEGEARELRSRLDELGSRVRELENSRRQAEDGGHGD